MHRTRAASILGLIAPRVCGSKRICALLVVCLVAGSMAWSDDFLPIARPVTDLPVGLPPFPKTEDDLALVDYGAFLFRSNALSSDRTIACVSCHVPELGFSGASSALVGVGGRQGSRHAPPIFNLYIGKTFMLDGRAGSLVDQVHLPVESPTEMNADWPTVLARLDSLAETRSALRTMPDRTLDETLVVQSLAAYIRSLVSGGSPFDRFYYGGDPQAISEQAKQGLLLFIRKGRCSGCHLITGYAAPLTDGSFHSIGIGFDGKAYHDVGRSAVTGAESDRGAFKTPTLRNVAARRYFMHDGSMTSLRDVIDYYNKGGNRDAPNLDGRIRPLFLTEPEIDSILAFLKTLNSPVQSYRPVP